MPNTLNATWVVNGTIYPAGTEQDAIPKADRDMLNEREAFGKVELHDFGTVSLDDQEREELERRGVVDRPPRHLPGTFLAGGDETPSESAPEPNADGDDDAEQGGSSRRGRGR